LQPSDTFPGLYKNAKRIYGVFTDEGTCLLGANVVLPRLEELTTLPQIPELDLRGHFAAVKTMEEMERKRKERKWRKCTE